MKPLSAALDYGRRGWPVIPLHAIRDGRCTCRRSMCDSPGKHPRLAAWPTQATTNERTIIEWWRTWPDANVGIVTGDGLLVLDVDPRHGGDATLAEWERGHGTLPDTPRAQTGGGGVHVFLRVEGPVPNRVGLAPGLDVRGDGGFVVAPPSIHASGRCYAWELGADPGEGPLASAPAWLLELLARSSTGDRLRANGTPLVLRKGERNRRLFQLGGMLRRYGLGTRALRACLEAINAAHCQPPLPADEVARIATSATRFAPAAEPFLPSPAFPRCLPRDDFEAVVGKALRADS